MRVSTLVILLAIIGGGLFFAYKKGYIGQAQKGMEQSFSVHFNKGQVLYTSQKYDEAIVEFQKAVELEPRNTNAPAAMRRIGDCYKEKRELPKALEWYQRIIQDYPDWKMRGQVEQEIEKVKSLGYT